MYSLESLLLTQALNGVRTVTAEVASSSLVVPAILFKELPMAASAHQSFFPQIYPPRGSTSIKVLYQLKARASDGWQLCKELNNGFQHCLGSLRQRHRNAALAKKLRLIPF